MLEKKTCKKLSPRNTQSKSILPQNLYHFSSLKAIAVGEKSRGFLLL